METVVKRLYEAMFLVDSAQAAADWDGINTTIKNILEKAGAEIVSIRKWDERKLVYEIKGKSRGTYILCYFRADGTRIRDIERDVQLSERIIRVLILSAEHMIREDIEKDTPAVQAKKHEREVAQEAAEKAQAESASAKEEAEKVETEEAEEPEPRDDRTGADESEQSERAETEED